MKMGHKTVRNKLHEISPGPLSPSLCPLLCWAQICFSCPKLSGGHPKFSLTITASHSKGGTPDSLGASLPAVADGSKARLLSRSRSSHSPDGQPGACGQDRLSP